MQVICAGLLRTGTSSISRALEILLDGPIKSWMKVLLEWPPTNAAMEQEILNTTRVRTDGYVAITDAPGSNLVQELVTLYPDAKVVCIVCDDKAWERSMGGLNGEVSPSALHSVLFLLPTMRLFPAYVQTLILHCVKLYGESNLPIVKTYHRHIAYLKSVVPPERLIFFDVRDGWKPLCKALDLPVPENVSFPNINDGKAIQAFAMKQIKRGLGTWLLCISIIGVGSFILFKAWGTLF
ncbi:uncharacterized protein BDZ83DRAFT_724376 [Colletotrichum acutatum]|uniref:NAD dependent epimerase/dehydratase n=1 Tax=Glomerella acutata TaxID=27357 RepID=A0AAD8UAQ4_GLOAC|nr:uncharacterized protein BDZ83DRAFT_724376 [Colletotrichum acutatum]KAK1708668.1 hypothetical protein BDZ83DRAFT_724376 [Colletotrichum acutatum]